MYQEDSLESWIYQAYQYYQKGYSFKKIKEMIGGSKADFDALNDYITQNKYNFRWKMGW